LGKRATIVGTACTDDLIGTDRADVIVGLGEAPAGDFATVTDVAERVLSSVRWG
jgi:hypothetical protein